jgi:hypothetical protein
MTTYTNLGISSIIEIKFKNLDILRKILDASKNHSELRMYIHSVDESIESMEDSGITDEMFSGLFNLKSDEEIEDYVEKCWDEHRINLGYEIIVMYNVLSMDGKPYIRHQIFGEAGLSNIEDLASELRKAKALFLEIGIPEDQIKLGYRMSKCD